MRLGCRRSCYQSGMRGSSILFASVLAMAASLEPGTPPGDLHHAAATVAAHGPVVVVKNGADGALLVRPDGTVLRRPGRAVIPVDTTGAGDSFDAGLLAALVAGHPETTALAWADTAGRLATQAFGGTASQPTRQELLGELGVG